MTERKSLRTPAWLRVGLFGSRPGVLVLANRRLAFIAEEGRLFDTPLAEVTGIAFPWYYFGGGMKVTVADKKYRLSFVRPNGAEDIPGPLLARLGNPMGLLVGGQKIVDIGMGRPAGKAWKAALLPAPAAGQHAPA